MKLQTKLLLHLFISIFIALLIMSYIIVKMIGMQSTANSYANTMLKVEQFNSAMVSYQLALSSFGRNPTENNYLTLLNKYNNILEKAQILKGVPFENEEETRRINFIHKKLDHFQTYMDIIMANNRNKTIEAMQLSSKTLGILNDIFLLNLSLHDNYTNLTKEHNRQIVYISITSGVILLLVSGIINLIMTRRIVTPIKLLSIYSQKIASGDLSIKEMDTITNDEVGQLAQSFNIMKRNLMGLINRIQNHLEELKEKNERINDSISYAERIQQAVIPHEKQIVDLFSDSFLIWKPRDIVGGDFYWCHATDKGFYIAVGDCTGHGVPGALMTTLAISALNHLVDHQEDHLSPAIILEKLNQTLKKNLNQQTVTGLTDDGLDIGLCYIESGKVTFAGSKLTLYKKTAEELFEIKGDRKSIGYRRTPMEYHYTDQTITDDGNSIFYITTDGFIDQNGGDNDYSIGKNTFIKIIEKAHKLNLLSQKELFLNELHDYMGERPQRDDITVIGFKI